MGEQNQDIFNLGRERAIEDLWREDSAGPITIFLGIC